MNRGAARRHVKTMGLRIHVHDEWEEAKHPRAKTGQFGAGAVGTERHDLSTNVQRSWKTQEEYEKLSTKMASKLKPNEKKAAKTYFKADQYYEKFNAKLRTGGELSSEEQAVASGLDAAISKSTLPQDARLLRGVNNYKHVFGVDRLEDIKIGSTMTDKAYTSTTMLEHQAIRYMSVSSQKTPDFERALIVIDAPKGTEALAAGTFNMKAKADAEVLLPRGQRYEVTAVHMVDDPGGKALNLGHAPQIHLRVIDSKTTDARDRQMNVGRRRVRDSVASHRFHTTTDRGFRTGRTPEGFLVCHDVPIARTGLQIYSPDEVPVKPGPEGYVRIERYPEDVFRPETIRSFEGKPVVNEHPDDDVKPENYRDLVCGSIHHVRRGEGIEDDLLLADLLVMEAEAIADVLSGKREVSCGYDSKYEDLEPGRARQYDIIGNHVALVSSARCGPRCSIRDAATIIAAVMPAVPDCECIEARTADGYLVSAITPLIVHRQPRRSARRIHVHL